jgi:hypothetical protein
MKSSQLILVKNKNKMVEYSYERKKISEINPDAVLWDNLDDAIIGITEDGRVVYDIGMLEKVVWRNNKKYMTSDEAREWVSYNILQSYVGEHTPIHIWTIPTSEEEE